MDGFTSIREAGGAEHSVARLLAEGKIIGPRLFYSGRALTQTGGGADFRTPDEVVDPCGQAGPFTVMSVIADGIDNVRKAAREELRRGAAQIKVFVSGGVVSPSEAHPTIYEYSLEELGAIVEEAKGRAAPTSWRTSTPTREFGDVCLPEYARSNMPISSAKKRSR